MWHERVETNASRSRCYRYHPSLPSRSFRFARNTGQSLVLAKAGSGRLYMAIRSIYVYRSPSRRFFISIIFLMPSIIFALFNSPSPFQVVSQTRGNEAGFSPSHPTAVNAFIFYREGGKALFSLVDSRRILRTHARRCPQSIWFEKKNPMAGIFGRLESSEKTIAILGDGWWPQTAKQDGGRISKHFLCSIPGMEEAQ